MSDFNATVLLNGSTQIPTKTNEVQKRFENCSTNDRNLQVIRLFDKGDCKVSSISSISNKGNEFAFKVEFNTVRNEDVESIIEKFNEVFIVKSISEVAKK